MEVWNQLDPNHFHLNQYIQYHSSMQEEEERKNDEEEEEEEEDHREESFQVWSVIEILNKNRREQ